MRTLPPGGRPVDEVIDELVAKRSDDARWEDGRTFGMVYDGGPEVMRAGIEAIDGIRVLGDGRLHLIAMSFEPDDPDPIDIFALGDALMARGWHHDRQGPPDSLHSTVSNTNTGVVDDYLEALAASVAEVRGQRTDDRSTNDATLE